MLSSAKAVVLGFALAVTMSSLAKADVFAFDFTGPNVSGTGQIMGDQVSPGVFALTSISGFVTDSDTLSASQGSFTISGLSAFAGADNQVTAKTPFIDFQGISAATIGGPDFNFFLNNDGTYSFINSGDNSTGVPGDAPATEMITSLNITAVSGAVPEASTWVMMLLGFAGFGLLGHRKARKTLIEKLIAA